MEYRGVVYNKAFGKLVRDQDRIQARINEGKRNAFFN